MLRQEQTGTAWPRASTPTLHCAMKVNAPRIHSARRGESPRSDVRTPHLCTARGLKGSRASTKTRPGAFAAPLFGPDSPPCILARATLPRPLPSPVARLALPDVCGSVWVRHALPQRNCGRISRPSLFLQSFGIKNVRHPYPSLSFSIDASPIPRLIYVISKPRPNYSNA